MILLPPREDVCQACAVKHMSEEPHNAQSQYYQYWFYGTHGRWPKWADAVAHCKPEVRSLWRKVLERLGKWTEPSFEEGDPIADPPAESIRQSVGDTRSRSFGPEQEFRP